MDPKGVKRSHTRDIQNQSNRERERERERELKSTRLRERLYD